MNRRRTLLVVGLTLVLTASLSMTSATAEPVAGSQGTDTSLPATDSQVTVNGRGQFADLAITVNQTAELNNQAISITWTGGTPTVQGPGRFGSQFLQIMQCWGDDDGSVPGNPGPPPEQCVYGASNGVFGGFSGSSLPGGFTTSRIVSRSTWPGFDASVGFLETSTTNVWLPFRSVNGTEVAAHTDPAFNPSLVGGNYWLNPFFNIVTTNEIPAAVTGLDGKGAELFELHTGVQSSGLGCGQTVQPVAAGGSKVPKCWLVLVPRGSAAEENVGTPFEERADQFGVFSSPLASTAWKNRIAIPLEFNPVDSPCSLGDEERRLAGSELALGAVASWQPMLCASGDLPPYSFAPISDASARQQLAAGTKGSPGLVVVSRPLSGTSLDPAKPTVYAPLSVSGLTIGFNIERNPKPDAGAEALQLAGVRVAELNLTPRLVAKLLTQSYQQQVTILQAPDYPWMADNPAHLGFDPDFLQFNPEFELFDIADGRTFSGLQLPAGGSDAAQQIWEWVFADPEARAWLNGEPDEWGMRVNPVYGATAASNSAGQPFGDPLPNAFPKGDPYCYQAAPRGPGGSVIPPVLCGTDWMPYARGFADAARVGRTAYDGARIVENAFAASAATVWGRGNPQFLGRRVMLVLTDTPSAVQYGLQMARLSRAGDNSADRVFVAPNTATLTAGLASMAAKQEPSFLEPAPSTVAAGAYPLTAVTYAAIRPLSLDTQARSEYAAFIEYAAGPGQVPGVERGELPGGYAPLPESLQLEALAAADQVRTLVPVPVVTTTTTTTTVPRRTTSTTPRATVPATLPPSATTTATTVVAVVEATTTTLAPVEVEPEQAGPTIITPIVEVARSRFAVPGLGAVVLGSALGVLEITKRPRRRRAAAAANDRIALIEDE